VKSNREQRNYELAHQPAPDDQPRRVATSLNGLRARANHLDQYEHHDHDARTLRALQALTDTALSHLSLEALLPELLERVRAVMQVDNVAILLLDENTQELEVSAARGPEDEVVGRVQIPVGVGFAGRVAETRAPLAVSDLSAYPVSNPLLRDRLRSALGVPLLAGDRVLGVVHIGTTTPREFTADEEALLEQAADRIARAVERAQLFRAERDASLALQRQASLINLSFEPIFAWSLEGGIVEWNAGAEQLYGYTRVEALGRVSHDLLRTVHPIPLKTLVAVLERDGQWAGELRHTTKDGREVMVESRQQIIDLDGQRLILETNRDVTERRRLERRTREALEAFIAISRTLVEAPEEGEDTGDDGSSAHEGLAERARLRNESPLAQRLAELTRSILGCSRVSVSAVEGGERMLARPVTIVGLTPELERRWWAEQEAQQPQEVGTGLLPEERDRLLRGEVIALDLTRPPYEFPNDYGTTAILGAPMRMQGRLVGLLGLDFLEPDGKAHDFTPEEIQIAEAVARLGAVVLERERLLREREEARAEVLALAEANRRMDEFLGIAGHELRTPLTTVKANLQMAERRAQQALRSEAQAGTGKRGEGGRKRRDPVEELLRLLERATQSAERQERLVKDLLDVSRISAGRLKYRMAPLDLTPLVREMVEEQRLHEPTRIIELEAPREHVRIVADPDRLGQVLTNYLTNALKYSEGDRPVGVTLRVEGATARVEVRDQGPGLSSEQQPSLFERFHRIQGIEVVSGSGVGLGLGLYISKTIVAHHGGQVGVESVPGEGSTFWFTLPLAHDAG
jgi:PAS domain S-box-containing protein